MNYHKKNIVWLASYPRSGNTWFRIFLNNLLYHNNNPLNINRLDLAFFAGDRNFFDEVTGVPSEDLTHEEIDHIRPEVYRYYADETDNLVFIKANDAYTYLPDGRPLFPGDSSYAVIYLIRNPLDVAVSFAHFNAIDPSRMIDLLNHRELSFCNKTAGLDNQLRQKLGSWSEHVKSWTDQTNIPVWVVRYEDMVQNKYETFMEAVYFLNLNKTPEEVKKAIDKSELSVLKKQEEKEGFIEKPMRAASFFRKGVINEGLEWFVNDEIKKVIKEHKEVLERFGYLNNNKNEILIK